MNMAWDKFQKEAEKIEVRDPNTAKQKMQKLQLAMNLRRRLRERFHTRGVDTPDYTKWIAKVEADTRQLADALLSMPPSSILQRFAMRDARPIFAMNTVYSFRRATFSITGPLSDLQRTLWLTHSSVEHEEPAPHA